MFVKSKDTEYNGILYRSVLESKWATFFDEHRIEHKYEYERIDLGIDTYLPDFWLPKYSTWIEIKPYKQKRAHSKCFRLALERSQLVLLVQGDPFKEDYKVDLFDCSDRMKFSFRTRVSEEEIRPYLENFKFEVDTDGGESELLLVNPAGERLYLSDLAKR